MKITKQLLREIIEEEIKDLLNEDEIDRRFDSIAQALRDFTDSGKLPSREQAQAAAGSLPGARFLGQSSGGHVDEKGYGQYVITYTYMLPKK